MKGSRGCWTCRLRRKKCDEKEPTCGACAKLEIQCHGRRQKRPDWMDGGIGQAKMAEQVKCEIKMKARVRRGEPASVSQIASDFTVTPTKYTRVFASHQLPDSICEQETTDIDTSALASQGIELGPPCGPQRGALRGNTHETDAFEGSEVVLSLFYLEKVLPFLFPFYSSSLLQGGKAWILEMIVKRPAIRQAILCQSYYFSVACGEIAGDATWNSMLKRAEGAFCTLRESLKVIENLDIEQNLGCTVRVMASILQVHRFEITILSFKNWQTHLNAVIGLFEQLLSHESGFNGIINRLGPTIDFPGHDTHLPNSEQAAFRFSSALITFDDIIASTTLQIQPRLYSHHRSLLGSESGNIEPPVNMEAAFGVQNWVLLLIGEIATLDAWKMECKRIGSLDILILAERATTIKLSLTVKLAEIENEPAGVITSSLDRLEPGPESLITRIWAHAALLYLFVVTSGWQIANDVVQYHVSQVIDLIYQIDPHVLLRTVVWPFCVAGCLAEPAQRTEFRQLVPRLEPPKLFSNLHKSLEIIERAWEHGAVGVSANLDMAMCFSCAEDILLLL